MTPSHPLVKSHFSLLFPITQPMSFWQPAWQPVIASLVYGAYVSYLLHSCFARVRLLSCTCFKRYFSIIQRNCMFVVLFSSRLVSRFTIISISSRSDVFYKNKTSAVTLIKQCHACNCKVWRLLLCMRVWTPRDRHIEFLCRGSDPQTYYSYIDWGSRPPH